MRHGFLLIRKPRGPTSHDIVAAVRKRLSERKVGHLGTLDPMADGLMVLAVGAKALKVVEIFSKLGKQYVAEIRLGAISTTYDAEGMVTEVTRKAGWQVPEDASRIQAIIDDRFLGKIQQVPPVFSAVHVGGERAYRKAMRGESVEMKARETTISRCAVLDYQFPVLRLSVSCDSGTYIRSLAHDLGESMKCGGYLTALTRTRVGDWHLENAYAPDDVAWTDVLPMKDVLRPLGGVEVSVEELRELSHGRPVRGKMPSDGSPLLAWYEGLPVAMLEKDSKRAGMLKTRKLF